MTPELQEKISVWRQRAAAGTLTIEEQKEIVTVLRAGRLSAAQSSATKTKAKAKAAVQSADDMLRELRELG